MNMFSFLGRGLAPRIALGSLAVTALGAGYAAHRFYDRPGETALNLVPANALVAGSFDLSPSPSQTVTFKNIEDALQRNGDEKEPFERSILDGIVQTPSVQPLREFTTRSGAGCLLKSPDAKDVTAGVMFFPLTDGAAAEKILETTGRPEYWKGTRYFRLAGAKMGMFMSGDNLVISDAPWALHEIGQVIAGTEPALVNAPEYKTARAGVPADANALVLVSPAIGTMGGVKFGGSSMTGWSAVSIRIEDNGVAFAFNGKSDVNSDSSFQEIANTAPLRGDLLQVLPPNAYGIVAISQPGKIVSAIEDEVTKASDDKNGQQLSKSISDAEKSMTKELGIDFKGDVLPAFQGDAVFGIYPSASPTAGVDLLVLVDDQHGATPSELADKFQSYIDRQVAKDAKADKNWYRKIDRTDATEYRLGFDAEKEMHKNLTVDKSVHSDILVGKKTVAWAKVGETVMLASSQELLDQAISSYQAKTSGLAHDPAIASEADPSDGSQMIAAFSPSRIAEGIRNTCDFSQMSADNKKSLEQALSAFQDLKAPLVLKGKTQPDGTSSGKIFIPLDYVKLIDLFSSMSKGNK